LKANQQLQKFGGHVNDILFCNASQNLKSSINTSKTGIVQMLLFSKTQSKQVPWVTNLELEGPELVEPITVCFSSILFPIYFKILRFLCCHQQKKNLMKLALTNTSIHCPLQFGIPFLR
jgi:hypothetical protein